MEAAETSAGRIRELNEQHTPETQEYGVTSFVFKARRPFHPERLDALTTAGFRECCAPRAFFGWQRGTTI